MQDRKFNIAFCFFNYGGNGGIAMVHPSLRRWWADSLISLQADPRIDLINDFELCDTPITMTRNRAVEMARELGSDFLVMIDSDQVPDVHLDEPGSQPFLQSSLNFAIRHYDRGPTCIMAPYCGPPPHENVYGFHWANYQNDVSQLDHRLVQYTREHAAVMGGIQNAAAGPTGLSLWDVRAFDVLAHPYFYYEYRDKSETEKASTEDVTASRDLALIGCRVLGYNPVFINWDAWAGHAKPKIVEKPRVIHSDEVSSRMFARASTPRGVKLVTVGEEIYGSSDPKSVYGAPIASAMRELQESHVNGNGSAKAAKSRSRAKR